jgi:hypothetical protein
MSDIDPIPLDPPGDADPLGGSGEPGADHDGQQPGERTDGELVPEEYPEQPIASLDFGTTVAEMREGESLEDRLAREVPDVGTEGFGADVDDDEQGTPLLDDADELGVDGEQMLTADRSEDEPHGTDSGHPMPPVSAEEAAVTVVDEDHIPGAVDRPPVDPGEA